MHKGEIGYWAWPVYLLGIFMCIGGLYLLAPATSGDDDAARRQSTRDKKDVAKSFTGVA